MSINMQFSYLPPIALLCYVAIATPTTLRARGVSVAADMVRAISPASASCDGAPYPLECRTAEEAAPAIELSFQSYGINTAGEAAAVLSTIAFESGNFKYQNNHFPGNPGQGSMYLKPWNIS